MAESDKLRKSNEKAGRKSISPPRVAKGPRPYFFDDANVDKLLAMIMALAGEVSVLRERLDTHERLAKTQTWADTDNIEAYEPAAEIKLERDNGRTAYLARVLRIVTDDLEQLKRN
jgi:hypothetical protein